MQANSEAVRLKENEMPQQKIITASLEGMRVLVDEKQCELQEYDFSSNQWSSKDGRRGR
jgi:hypothetical protein